MPCFCNIPVVTEQSESSANADQSGFSQKAIEKAQSSEARGYGRLSTIHRLKPCQIKGDDEVWSDHPVRSADRAALRDGRKDVTINA